MASRPRRRRMRLGAVAAGLIFAALAVGIVNAGSGDPTSIHLQQTGTLGVSASGGWNWAEMLTNAKLSYAGFAIDWGDVTSGNAVPKPGGGAYHVGDGTAATNVVMQPTNPAQGASGTWGPVSHTYAKAGKYTVCVILYDLGETKPFKATGYHGLRAGGTDRNTDNSVEQNGDIKTNCATIDLTPPSPAESVGGVTSAPSPVESVGGATSAPQVTPPPTSSSESSTLDVGAPALWTALVLLLVAIFLAAFLAAPQRRRR